MSPPQQTSCRPCRRRRGVFWPPLSPPRTLLTAACGPLAVVAYDDLKFDTNSKCPLCIPPQSQKHCCDIHNVVGNQFHRHYNTVVQIQWSYRPSHITTQYSSGNNVFGPCLLPTGKWRLTETILVLVLFFIPFLLVFFPIVWPS
jgi:hypothetical protein